MHRLRMLAQIIEAGELLPAVACEGAFAGVLSGVCKGWERRNEGGMTERNDGDGTTEDGRRKEGRRKTEDGRRRSGTTQEHKYNKN